MTLAEIALDMLKFSQANISGHKVGAALLAENAQGFRYVSSGCNIELATSKVWHAEEVALVKALSEGFLKPLECYVTSTNTAQRAAMCGYCVQHFMYANPDCKIFVVNMDGSIKIETTVRERNGPLAYLGRGKLDGPN